MPKGNVGIHNAKSASEFGSSGHYFLKLPREEKEKIYANSANEHVTTIRKAHYQHWALSGLPREFKVFSKNRWDPHPVNSTDLARDNYRVLAESQGGPQIVEHMHTLAVQFVVSPKYPESVRVLSNFLSRRAADVYSCVTSSHGNSRSDSQRIPTLLLCWTRRKPTTSSLCR